MNLSLAAAAVVATLALSTLSLARADEPNGPASAPAPTKHQIVKDCMAKEKVADSGLPKEDLRRTCRDLAKTEKQNADRAAKAGEPQT